MTDLAKIEALAEEAKVCLREAVPLLAVVAARLSSSQDARPEVPQAGYLDRRCTEVAQALTKASRRIDDMVREAGGAA